MALLATGLTAPAVYGQTSATTSSPLEILSHAPKVRLDDEPAPTPQPPVRSPAQVRESPVPYVPPRGAAPYVQPVPPAFTPYAGRSTTGAPPPVQQPGYSNSVQQATPTPRPILGPEDMERDRQREPEKKRGIIRGLIRAIPFVGGDDDEQEPTPTPRYDRDDVRNTVPNDGQVYRGYDTDEPLNQNNTGGPLLLPPGSTPLPGNPVPSPPSMLGNQPMRSNEQMRTGQTPGLDEIAPPPILTPEPRFPPPIGADMEPLTDTTPGAAVNPPDDNAPVLTVKRESDETSPTAVAPAESANTAPSHISSAPADPVVRDPAEEKKPDLARRDAEPTPLPLERATTGVLIQPSRPSEENSNPDTLGPAPDPSAITIKPYDPTGSATPERTPTPAADDLISTLTIEQPDLGMPNPAYEQNTTVLAEFQDAVRKARGEDYTGAATAFREYALNHPSSGLAPRAAFLAVIFERSRSQARENLESLERLFPESRYVKEAAKRRGDELAQPGNSNVIVGASTSASLTESSAPTIISSETPEQQIARLEKELTLAVGDPAKEPELRKVLGILYLGQHEYERAYEVLRPAAEMAQGQQLNGEIMVALGRALVARGETVQAISLYEAVEQKYPGLIESNVEAAWSAGLAFEGAGRYTKARSLYNLVRQKWPTTSEAGWATARLNDLATLRQ